ncbi:XTP/dITP diphosphatase [Furfurilactobacillus sp. WILCCON 0119]|uniref:XTP/dITP diphosphatase n=1 Tax=Furfurilactobacillus entadae TaxID=2922307 RepID=UPI0035E699B4
MADAIVIATNNAGKAAEYKERMAPLNIKVLTLADFPDVKVPEENGTSFAENAQIKADALAKLVELPIIADDSGLQVDALNGQPGIHSARYAGDHDDAANNAKLLAAMDNVPDAERTANFHTTIVAVKPNGKRLVVSGDVSGLILREPHGTDGFGYDPLFYVAEKKKTFAELTTAEKNEVSHRGRAIASLMEQFPTWWRED